MGLKEEIKYWHNRRKLIDPKTKSVDDVHIDGVEGYLKDLYNITEGKATKEDVKALAKILEKAYGETEVGREVFESKCNSCQFYSTCELDSGHCLWKPDSLFWEEMATRILYNEVGFK